MRPLQLSFRGTYTFDLVRDALGDALTALGAPSAPWEEVSRRALDDRNLAGAAFEGVWRRGDATLTMSASTDPSRGDPYNGYGYDTLVTLDAPGLTFSSRGGSMDGAVNGLHAAVAPDAFRAARAALAARLACDESDQSWVALANVEALEGVDPALQREILTAALAHHDPADSARGALLRWSEKRFGGGAP